jgi:DNA-nicking Smr family endonuclease
MKSDKPSLTHNPFEDIKDLLKKKPLPLSPKKEVKVFDRQPEPNPDSDEKLFSEAMEGVTPISRDNRVERVVHMEAPLESRIKEDAEVLAQLESLVRYGTGFDVSNTPEYVEGTGYNVHPEFAKRLHRGDYSIQAHIDLHGLTAEDARDVFEKFIKGATTTGKRGVLIIHGRGLSSPAEPVLKRKVIEWLTRGPWRKWVVAYSSARICDGGAGATYVLLRPRPVSKRLKIKKRNIKGN